MIAALVWMIRAYNVVPYQRIWDVGILGPPVILILMYFATVFFLCSVTTQNPTLVGFDALHHDVAPGKGIYSIVRHPMMAAFALWSAAHAGHLEAFKLLISEAASRTGVALMHVDICRAYFYAKARREVYIQLPDEDFQDGDEECCGKLDFSMYGTRDAANNWEQLVVDPDGGPHTAREGQAILLLRRAASRRPGQDDGGGAV